ncbi:hypothetical protein ABIE58_002499 [Roseovarius sp. MBR-78]|uniref:hypothetical protein n=1 Tax=Roseovarius sp. MBR-78 TaxID=3156460 RepID=UPI003398E29C
MITKVFAAAATAIALSATSAAAWEGHVVECYGKVWYPAEYSTSKVLVKHGKTAWEHRNGQMVKVHYAPVYKEVKTKTKDGHWIMRQEACIN